MHRRLAALALAVLMAAGCARGTGDRQGLTVAGSTSVQPLAEVLAEAYARGGGGRVSVQGGGSTAGVQAVLSGVARVGAVSRDLTPDELGRGLRPVTVAWDVLAVVVHPANLLHELTVPQLRRIFAGEVRDWRQFGGRPGPIHLVSREAGSGTREGFRRKVGPVSPGALVLGSSGAIRLAVAGDPQAIGYVSLGVLQLGGVRALKVAGHRPEESGYPLARPLAFVTLGAPSGEAAEFLRFALSPAGQRLVRAEGLVPASERQVN